MSKQKSKQSSKLLVSNTNANPFVRVLHALDEKSNSQIYRHRLVGVTSVAGTVTGVNTNYALNGVQYAQDWSSFANLYDEFRVLGIRVHYRPRNRYTAVSHFITWYYDNDNITLTPSSDAQAVSYANSKFTSSADSTSYDGIFSITPDGPEQWWPCGSPSSQLGMIGCFSTVSFGGSITIGDIEQEYICEFRGRR